MGRAVQTRCTSRRAEGLVEEWAELRLILCLDPTEASSSFADAGFVRKLRIGAFCDRDETDLSSLSPLDRHDLLWVEL